jgi:hypothetical protein
MKICITKAASLVLLLVSTNLFFAAARLSKQQQLEQQHKKDLERALALSKKEATAQRLREDQEEAIVKKTSLKEAEQANLKKAAQKAQEEAIIAESIALENAVKAKRIAQEKAQVATSKILIDAAQAVRAEKGVSDLVESVRSQLLTALDIWIKVPNQENYSSVCEKFISAAATAGVLYDKNFSAALSRRLPKLPADKDLLKVYLGKIIDGSFGLIAKSFVDPKGQYEYSKIETTACGAMASIAMSKLKDAGSLEVLYNRDKGNVSSLIDLGGKLYVNAAGGKAGEYLTVEKIRQSKLFPKNLVLIKQNNIKIEELNERSDPMMPLSRVLNAIEKYSHNVGAQAEHAAVAGGDDEKRSVYALVTFSHQIIMIYFNPFTGSWILFDSHRGNKYTNTGAGFHDFSSKINIQTYLVGYQGLDFKAPIDYELFS